MCAKLNDSAPTPAPTAVKYHAGEKLVASEANPILRARPTKVIFFAGSRKCGKTTFLARIGELFRDGQFADYRFAGSLSLCAMERVTWLATTASGALSPDTPRTSRVENDTYIHLRVHRVGNTQSKIDLLLSDLAGETFPNAVSTQQFCSDLDSLGRADHLVVFLDSERLANNVLRHPEVDNVRTFLSQVTTVKHNKALLTVDVVFSRWDFIERDQKRAELEQYCKTVESDILRRFGDVFGAIRFWQIAARPAAGLPPTNSKIQEMFSKWIDGSPVTKPIMDMRTASPGRDFSAFGTK